MAGNKPVKKPSLAWPIISFAFTILLLVAYNDTLEDNWYLLVLFLISDFAGLGQYFQQKKAYERLENLATTASSPDVAGEPLSRPAHITVTREGSMVGAAVAYKVYLNGRFMGDVKNKGQLTFDTQTSRNTVSILDKYGNPFKDEVFLSLADGGNAEVFVKAGRVLTDRTYIASSPSGASL